MRGDKRMGWGALWAALVLGGCHGHAQPRTGGATQCVRGPRDVALRLQHTVEYLADDAREGRGTGTPGDAETVAYLVRNLTALGLEPAGESGFEQPFAVLPGRPGHHASAQPLTDPLPPGALRTSNVLARIPGTAPDAATRPVFVLGAHRDHIGHGGPSSRAPGSTEIHNGADDNASGVAALLELARQLRARPVERTVVLVWFGAEELGLLGSRFLVEHPLPATQQVGAMMNMDMVGRLNGCRLFVEGSGLGPAVQRAVHTANDSFHLDARPWESWRGSWGASDHMNFSRVRVPTLFFFTGLHPDYHAPSDDPPTLDYPGLAAVTRFAEAVLRQMSALPDEALRWQRRSSRRAVASRAGRWQLPAPLSP